MLNLSLYTEEYVNIAISKSNWTPLTIVLLIPHLSSDRSFLVVLEINDVVESDAGLYKVRAKNKFGEVAASINLNFSRESTMINPRIMTMSLLSANC